MAPLASLLPAALLITEALGGGALGRGGFAPTSLSTRSALFNASLALQGPVVTAQVGWALAAARRAGWFDWGQTALAAAQAALRWNNRSAAEAPAGSGAGERWPAAWAIDGDAVGSLRPLPGSTLSSDASGLLAAAELVIPPVPAVAPSVSRDETLLLVIVIVDITIVGLGALSCIAVGMRSLALLRSRLARHRLSKGDGVGGD